MELYILLQFPDENTVNVLEIPVASIRKGLRIKSGQFADVWKGKKFEV